MSAIRGRIHSFNVNTFVDARAWASGVTCIILRDFNGVEYRRIATDTVEDIKKAVQDASK